MNRYKKNEYDTVERKVSSIVAEVEIDPHCCDGNDIRELLVDGTLISGEACDNMKWHTRVTSELLEDAGMEDDERINVEGAMDDSAPSLTLIIRYPATMALEIEDRFISMSDFITDWHIDHRTNFRVNKNKATDANQ